MKKTLLIILALTLAFSLAGCGLTEQWNEVKTEYIDPAVEKAVTGVDPNAVDELALGPNLTTDWSLLTEETAAENIGGRVSSGALDALTPSDSYGRLLPYVGAVVTGDDGEVAGRKYGLVTTSGDVALDPVLTALYMASYDDGTGGDAYLDILVMGRRVSGEDGETMKYALCGAKGDWATDFLYTAVYPTELGCVCIIDSEKNEAVCYDEAGELVFDVAKMGYNFKPGSLESLSVCGDGWMQIVYTNGQYGFVNTRGYLFNQGTDSTSYFDEARRFHEGFAAVRNNNLWSYVKSNGIYLVYQRFETATDFSNGVAAAKLSGGGWVVIDSKGETVREFEDASEITMGDGWLLVTNSVGGADYYSTPDIEPLRMYDMPALPYEGGMWLRGEFGSRIKSADGKEVYFSGVTELIGDVNNELFLMKLADESYAVMDTDGRVVMSGATLGFLTDAATGATCIYDAGDGCAKLYAADGTLMADYIALEDIIAGGGAGHSAKYGPVEGYTMCAEGSSMGWKDAGNNWIFRIKVPTGD